MLKPQVVRTLTLPTSVHPRGTEWLSAASGLVCTARHAYVIADDEHHLAHFKLPTSNNADTPVTLVQLFEGTLPQDKQKRKKAKPDLESLALLPPMASYPHGALLALGSGSKPNRCQGRLLPLDLQGQLTGEQMALDASPLYHGLLKQFDDLNIEGVFVTEEYLYLLQRGNKGESASACLLFPLGEFTAWLLGERKRPPVLADLTIIDLGKAHGVPICPTDATALPGGGWIFAAVAENTDDSYRDGPCLASYVGVMDKHNQLSALHRLHANPKVEGIAIARISSRASRLALWMVTDADDPAQPAQLLNVDIDVSR